MDSIREVVLELTRGHDAQVSGAVPHDGTEYLLRRGNGDYTSARFPWSQVPPADLQAVQGSSPGAQARQRVGAALRAFLDSLGWSTIETELLRALKACGGAEVPDICVTVRCNAAELCRLPRPKMSQPCQREPLGLSDVG